MHHTYFTFVAEVCALIIGSYFLGHIKSKFLFLYVFVLIGVCTESFIILNAKLWHQNTMWVSHIFFPLEFLFIALFYLKHLSPLINKRWILTLIFTLILYAVINVVFIQSINDYSVVRVFSSLILVFFSLVYLYKVMAEAKIGKLSQEPMIWANTAVLLGFSSIFFNSLLFNSILEYSQSFLRQMVYITAYILAIFYLLIAIAFWMEGRQQSRQKRISLE